VEDVGQEDAVIVAVRLVAKHGDVEPVAIEGEHVLDQARSGHAVADDDQPRTGARHNDGWLLRDAWGATGKPALGAHPERNRGRADPPRSDSRGATRRSGDADTRRP